MIIEGDDGIDLITQPSLFPVCLQMVVLFFFKWIDCEDEWVRWQEKTKLGFGYTTQDIIRVEDGS